MSTNLNRSKVNKSFNSRTYKLIFINYEYPDYCFEGKREYKSKGRFKPKRKLLWKYQVRRYKNWKHNRKTKYKQLKLK